MLYNCNRPTGYKATTRGPSRAHCVGASWATAHVAVR